MAVDLTVNITPAATIAATVALQGPQGTVATASDVETLAGTDAAKAVTPAGLFGALPAVSVKKFGAVGDGVTDDTGAFNAAISFANARLGNGSHDIVGTTITVPDGRYNLPTELNPITVSGVTFRGQSQHGTVLLLAATNAFTWGDSTLTRQIVGGGLANMKLEYLADPSSASSVVTLDYAFAVEFVDLSIIRIACLLKCGMSASRQAGGVTVRNVVGPVANVGAPLFDLRYGAGLTVSDTRVFVRGVAAPVHPAAMTTAANTIVFKCWTGNWDTVQVSNCLFERFDVGLSIAAGAGLVYQNFFFENTIFDYFKRWVIYADSSGGGVVAGIRMSNCWAVSWETHTFEFAGPTGINDLHHIAAFVPISGVSALAYSVAAAKDNHFQLTVGATNRTGAAAGALVFAANSTGFHVSGCDGADDYASLGLPWQSPWGIQIGADCDRYLVTNNKLKGSSGGYNLGAANAAGSMNRRVTNNVGTGYAGFGALAVPASTVAVTNTTATVWELYIGGGTVTAITKNGTALGIIAGQVQVEPGGTFSITYSVAPTVTRFIAP